jgi:hypothetical protein
MMDMEEMASRHAELVVTIREKKAKLKSLLARGIEVTSKFEIDTLEGWSDEDLAEMEDIVEAAKATVYSISEMDREVAELEFLLDGNPSVMVIGAL